MTKLSKLHTLRLVTLAGLTPLFALTALAQEVGQAYGGLSAGPARVKVSDRSIANTILGTSAQVSTLNNDTHDTGYKIFGGYQLTPLLAIEAGYYRLGQFSFNSLTTPAGTLAGRTRIQGLNADLVGTLPIGAGFTGLARVGAAYSRVRDLFDTTGAAVATDAVRTRNDVNVKLGVGLQYALSQSVAVRLEGERYRYADPVTSHGHVDLITVSLVMPFGGSSSGRRHTSTSATDSPRLASATPTPAADAAASPSSAAVKPDAAEAVAVAPQPADASATQSAGFTDPTQGDSMPPTGAGASSGAVVAANMPPATMQDEVAPPPRARIGSQLLFGFDQSSVRPEGRQALDTLSQQIGSTPYDAIQVEGHTDRLGSAEHNQALSLQRAESVKAYLVTNGKLDAQKIGAVGQGSSQPLTAASDCKGDEPTAALKACLQRDRRVDVNVTTTR